MRISKRWPRDLYRHCAADWDLDFSEDAAMEAYLWESRGSSVGGRNGYAWGKRWLNAMIDMWKEGLAEGTFALDEIVNDMPDPEYVRRALHA